MNSIHFSNANLHYSSAAYNESSLKTYVFQVLGLKYRKRLPDVHALKNITLDISAGERVGLIGHNGAGKSTFLKAIAGLYPISSGSCEVIGNVRSLLELNIGFEHEATGRENIFYRSLLLGQTPKQIRGMVDEIIEFAGLGEFIDFPLKTYSAGMQVRLAFAISTAIPGDILLLDEVIGAGDASFMDKSRQRINELMGHAETMILASHDLSAIRDFCSRAIVFSHGTVVFDGKTEDAVSYYSEHIESIVPMENKK